MIMWLPVLITFRPFKKYAQYGKLSNISNNNNGFIDVA